MSVHRRIPPSSPASARRCCRSSGWLTVARAPWQERPTPVPGPRQASPRRYTPAATGERWSGRKGHVISCSHLTHLSAVANGKRRRPAVAYGEGGSADEKRFFLVHGRTGRVSTARRFA